MGGKGPPPNSTVPPPVFSLEDLGSSDQEGVEVASLTFPEPAAGWSMGTYRVTPQDTLAGEYVL